MSLSTVVIVVIASLCSLASMLVLGWATTTTTITFTTTMVSPRERQTKGISFVKSYPHLTTTICGKKAITRTPSNGIVVPSATQLNMSSRKYHVTTYNYFAYGSNMCLDTMTELRRLKPLQWTPAVLKDYQLIFDIPGLPFVEPCWASVEYSSQNEVHGVLYELSSQDFAKVCDTEGVPFTYQLEKVTVSTYPSESCNDQESINNDKLQPLQAYALITSKLFKGRNGRRRRSNQQPSQSYLNVLIRGAKENGLDPKYVQTLQSIQPGLTLFGSGTAEASLKMAKMMRQN